jgi:glycosyltransferase involved in cell wall biosynthesis
MLRNQVPGGAATVDVVLPCLDEALALPWVLARIPAGMRAIVVDNGSVDGSAELARSLGATVVECSQRGYGAACHAGLLAATAEIIAFCDCDSSIDPSVLTTIAAPVVAGDVDLVVARRRPTEWLSWPLHARVANAVLAHRVRRVTGTNLRDLGPVRIARRESLLALALRDRRSGYPLETVLRASAAGWRISGADVDYRPRTGRSKVTGTVRGTLQAVRDMAVVLGE